MAAARCSCGTAAIGESDDPERGFKKGDLKFTLHGEKLHGSWVLVRMRGDRYGGKRTNWLLIKHRDEFAKEGKANDILDEDQSVASGRSMDQIAEGKGKAPKPFMTAKAGRVKADAVWHSNRGTQPRRGRKTARGKVPMARPLPGSRCEQGGFDQGVKGQESRRDAGFCRASACDIGRSPAQRRGMVPRDQIRRLPGAAARRGWRSHAENPQGTRLDRQV